VSLFFSIVRLFLSVAVALIAALQWRVADNKLRLDLFDRRYKAYDATRKFLAVILREAMFTNSDLYDFNAGTSDAEFLFRPDVAEYLAEIRKCALHLRTTRELLERPQASDDERSRYAKAQENDLLWLSDQIMAMTNTFTPYLGFANVRSRVLPPFKSFFTNRWFEFNKRSQLFIGSHDRPAQIQVSETQSIFRPRVQWSGNRLRWMPLIVTSSPKQRKIGNIRGSKFVV
jgi:hypothetical protein